jgi:hypothetical protein
VSMARAHQLLSRSGTNYWWWNFFDVQGFCSSFESFLFDSLTRLELRKGDASFEESRR